MPQGHSRGIGANGKVCGMPEADHSAQAEDGVVAQGKNDIREHHPHEEYQATVGPCGHEQKQPENDQTQQNVPSTAEQCRWPSHRSPLIKPWGRTSRINANATKKNKPGTSGTKRSPNDVMRPSRIAATNAPRILPNPPTISV